MEERILILAPRGRDAQIASDLLAGHRLVPEITPDLASLVAALSCGAGLVLMTEEALAANASDIAPLAAWVAAQPKWSDLPFILLGNGGSTPRSLRETERLQELGNVVLLQRPLHAEAILGAARSALKARRRQYELRAASETLERAVIERTADLQAARDTLEFAMNAVAMGSWSLDLSTGIIQRSTRHDEIFGYTKTLPEWSVGLLLQHVEPARREEISHAFDTALRTGALDIECPVTGGDGATRWISKKGRVSYDATGAPRSITGIVSDITERKEADAQLAQAQKMDAIGQLTGGVAHDFNNLLTPIVGSLDLVRRRHREDERTQRLISGALRAAERAATLTHRLLSFARRQALQPKPVDIPALIEGVAELMRRSLGPTVAITLDFPATLKPAKVDPNQLELALLNLAINARDAMAEGGNLIISARAETQPERNPQNLAAGDYVVITAADTGSGMDKETLSRATEPFFSTKQHGKGTGLGLSMVHGLAAQSGGTLRLFSRLGEGTRVELWLPATDEPASREAAPHAEPVTAARAAQVLLVDDEEIVRHATAEMLRDVGYQVEEAGSAAQALAVLRNSGKTELLVTDYLMPGMTGAALIAELRAAGFSLPVLLITGYAPAGGDVPEDVPRLAKPFRQVDLAAKLDELLRASA